MLPTLLEIPKTPEEWNRWSFQNRDHHQQIRQAIQAKLGLNLPEYQLDPINGSNTTVWLQNHAQTHGDMNSALGLQSVDLLDVHFEDPKELEAWAYLHWQEHSNAAIKLGI